MGVPMTLNEVKPGQSCKVVRLNDMGATRRRIMDMGITRGTEITVKKVAPLGDPIDMTVRGYHISLRGSDCSQIEVEAI